MASVGAGLYLKLLESGEFSDFVIQCGDVEFKVHRAIVGPASTLLQAAATLEVSILRLKLVAEVETDLYH